MQITIKGEMTLSDLRQAIFEQLGGLEQEFAIAYSQGATLYINPTDGEGAAVQAKTRDGRKVDRLTCKGPYKSAAQEFNI